MAKKIVRGITDVKTINNQDFDTNNVNDLLSDGQYNYIHRKKGKNEEYHNLTDNIKTISSDNTDLLTVTNNNKTTNTATLHPKHDAQKEQLLESQNNTINISHGTNGTNEKTKVDTNPEKVLEHENLLTDYGISKTTTGNTTKLGLEYTKVEDNFDLNNLMNGCVRSSNFINSPQPYEWFFVRAYSAGNYTFQEAVGLTLDNNKTFRRLRSEGVWGEWRVQVGDKSDIYSLVAKKEQVLESQNNTITINHGTNGTDEKTTVNTNPEKVLEHENLISNSQYVTIEHGEDSNTTEIKTDKLVTKLNELNNKIPTSVGCTNLLLYSADPWKAPSGYYQYNGATKTDNTLNGSVIYKTNTAWDGLCSDWGKQLIDRPDVKVGDEFTYSVYIRTDQESPINAIPFFRYNNQSDAEAMAGGKLITQEWQRFTTTFTVTKKMVSDSSKLSWVGFEQSTNSEDGKFVYYACNKLERGNIATDYSPNPEDVNTLLAQKQDVLTAGDGITIQGNTISASAPAPGASISIQDLTPPSHEYKAIKHVVTIGQQTLTTFSFECYGAGECVLTGGLKEQLETFVPYVGTNITFSNGAVSIENNATNMKLINSAPSENACQQATFTFYSYIPAPE